MVGCLALFVELSEDVGENSLVDIFEIIDIVVGLGGQQLLDMVFSEIFNGL